MILRTDLQNEGTDGGLWKLTGKVFEFRVFFWHFEC